MVHFLKILLYPQTKSLPNLSVLTDIYNPAATCFVPIETKCRPKHQRRLFRHLQLTQSTGLNCYSITPFIQKINIYRTFFRIICNSSAFGRTVTESSPLEVRFAKDWIHSRQNLHVLTYFAVNAKYWAELLQLFTIFYKHFILKLNLIMFTHDCPSVSHTFPHGCSITSPAVTKKHRCILRKKKKRVEF